MKLGFIGLGRMGKNMVLRLLEKRTELVVYNRSPEPVAEVVAQGALAATSLNDLVMHLQSPRVIWLMVTSSVVDEMLQHLVPLLSKGDMIIDGGNSYFEDSVRRGKELAAQHIHFLDCGTSGGMEGARHGACLMVGGSREAFTHIEPLIESLSAKNAYAHVGTSGSGHFIKMVHNGIEYGMMGALGEGMQLIQEKQEMFGIDMREVAKVYSHGSIIEGKLMTLLERGMKRSDFSTISGSVPKGETEDEMEKLESLGIMHILHQARMMRVASRATPTYSGKIVAVLRNEFGGHKVNTT